MRIISPDTAFSLCQKRQRGITADERRHMGSVARLGCIACRLHMGCFTPAEVHHIKLQTGIGRRSSHYDTIPLCAVHHRTGPYGLAFHQGPGAWEMRFGRQTELLERVRELLK
jgi:hypothetical protein